MAVFSKRVVHSENGTIQKKDIAPVYELLEKCMLPEEFKIQFQETSCYESFLYQTGETISVNYMTDSEETYD